MNMETSTTTEVALMITVALVSKAVTDLAKTVTRRQLCRADIVNRAISLYEFLDSERASGTEVLLKHPDGSTFLMELMLSARAAATSAMPISPRREARVRSPCRRVQGGLKVRREAWMRA
jgi:hypothetical protein